MYKILVVDDEDKIREVLREYAEFEGYEVTEAKDGMEAVRICKEKDFDVIVMDVMMPKLDGFSACKEIRKFKSTPFLMLSAKRSSIICFLNAVGVQRTMLLSRSSTAEQSLNQVSMATGVRSCARSSRTLFQTSVIEFMIRKSPS